MVEIAIAWGCLVALLLLRITIVGRIQWRALDIVRDIVDAGILNGAISTVRDIDLMYSYVDERNFYTKVFDLTRWTMHGFYPLLSRWEAAHK